MYVKVCGEAYTTPTTPVARRLVALPVKPKSAKMLGA
jgi:hypothetical protein